ncbi:hypothetical protein Rsub_11292, partial [Raphidocelis subcapitata]
MTPRARGPPRRRGPGGGGRGRGGGASSAAAVALVAAALLALAARAAAQPRTMPKQGAKSCGAVGQDCCPQCPPDTPLTACDMWSCNDGAACFQFANKQGLPPD